jgi:hypothetical protein
VAQGCFCGSVQLLALLFLCFEGMSYQLVDQGTRPRWAGFGVISPVFFFKGARVVSALDPPALVLPRHVTSTCDLDV